ncbi:hypothetical protein BH24BAC1_BH24BAC1_21750 [soil metagenome]
MKKLLVLVLLLLPGPLLAQNNSAREKWPALPSLPAKEGQIYFEEVVELPPSAPKDSLYKAAREWLADYFKTAQPELQKEDRAAGELITRSDHHYQVSVGQNEQEAGQNQQENPYIIHLQHTLHLVVKDGQYQYRLYDFTARDEIRNLNIVQELNPQQGQVREPRRRRSAKGNKNWEEAYMAASFRSKLLTGLEQEVKDMTQSLKSAMAKAASAQ